MMRAVIVLIVLIGFHAAGQPLFAATGCTVCHGSAEKMRKLGYPQFTVTSLEAASQTGMPAQCHDCHLGNALVMDRDKAHEGLLSLSVVTKSGAARRRAQMPAGDLIDWPSIEQRGADRATRLAPKKREHGELTNNDGYVSLLWHDRNADTRAFNPLIVKKTCGKCHPRQLDGFLRSSMGGAQGAHTQSQYPFWTSPSGPHSCGPWLGKAAQPAQDAFTDDNIALFNAHATAPVARSDAQALQRNCNVCHVGCLDCHYDPQPKTASPKMGVHTITRKPRPEACYGNGRSLSCHAEALELRRGDGYLRAEYTRASPEGVKVLSALPDVHAGKGVLCVDCHEKNPDAEFHADLRRDVNCAKCHEKAAAGHARGVHRNVDCAACHVALIGGVALGSWTLGPGQEAGARNPLVKARDFLSDAVPPLIIKNPGGTWIPVHATPHAAGSIKAETVSQSKGLISRNRPDAAVDRRYASKDSFAVTGLVADRPAGPADTLAWLQVDRVAHGIGKARACENCHAGTAQRIAVRYTGGPQGEAVSGSYVIVADAQSLRITDVTGPGGAFPLEPAQLKDRWVLRGDFSLPKIKNRKLYDALGKQRGAGSFSH